MQSSSYFTLNNSTYRNYVIYRQVSYFSVLFKKIGVLSFVSSLANWFYDIISILGFYIQSNLLYNLSCICDPATQQMFC